MTIQVVQMLPSRILWCHQRVPTNRQARPHKLMDLHNILDHAKFASILEVCRFVFESKHFLKLDIFTSFCALTFIDNCYLVMSNHFLANLLKGRSSRRYQCSYLSVSFYVVAWWYVDVFTPRWTIVSSLLGNCLSLISEACILQIRLVNLSDVLRRWSDAFVLSEFKLRTCACVSQLM